jgi:DHA2 family multidrug resistance protein
MATATLPAAPGAAEAPAVNPWVIAGTVTIATFMEVLDTSIANVAIPHIAGNLGVSQDDATWVLTTYLVANAIILPLSGWFAGNFGRKRFYMVCVALFTLSSLLCGLATSLPMLLLFRVMQGVGGGGLQPSTQGVLLDTFPGPKRGMAMAVYGMAVLVAPILGPTLGGWITDNFSWRWIFFINLPAGALSLVLNYFLLRDPDYLVAQREARRGQPLRFDYVGFGFLVLGLGCLEVVLDKGQEEDWFGSRFIVTLSVLAVIGLVGMVLWELRTPRPLINFRVLKDRNFAVSALLIFGMYAVALGSTAALPLMLQGLMGYDATHAGLIMSPAGLFTMAMLPLVGLLLSRGLDARWIIATGLLLMSAGAWWMAHTNLQIGPWQLVWPRVVQMVGSGICFAPLNTTAYAYIPKEQNNYATGLYNLLRNEGGSVGTSLAITLIARREQFHLARLGEHISPFRPAAVAAWQAATAYFRTHTSSLTHAQLMGWALIDQERQQQAAALAYYDVFWVFSLLGLCLIPMLLLMRRARAQKGAHPAAE